MGWRDGIWWNFKRSSSVDMHQSMSKSKSESLRRRALRAILGYVCKRLQCWHLRMAQEAHEAARCSKVIV